MNHSGGPHPKEHREAKPTDRKQINHKIDPEWLSEPHLREHSEGRNKESNDDAKNIAAGHECLRIGNPNIDQIL